MDISVNGSPFIANNSASQRVTNTSLERLSNGNRINQSGDDPAGRAISDGLSSQLSGLSAASRNSGDAISSIQVADGALTSLNENIGRIQELSIQSNNGALSETDRQALQQEATQLLDESNDILENTSFNGRPLLSNSDNTSVQLESADTNITVEGRDLQSEFETAGFQEIDISTQEGASAAIGVLNTVSEQISSRTAELGAASNRIESTIESISNSEVNTAEARSRISDADFAREASNLAASQVQDEIQIAVQSQANANNDSVLQLLSLN